MNNTTKIVHGAAWAYGRMAVTNIINLAVMAILARKLTPADFGLVALAGVLMHLLTLLATEGVNQFIIHDHHSGWEERMQAAFWLDLTMAVACTLVGMAMLPWITGFFEDPRLGAIILAMLLFFPIKSVAKVPDSFLRKNLSFKVLEIRDTFIEIAVAVASVALVFAGFGAWSIVIPGLGASLLRAIIVFQLSAFRPRFEFHFELWPIVFRYYAKIMGSAVTSFVLTDGDSLLIGKLMGNKALGIYNIGWQSANLVNRTLIGLGNKLALPTLATVARDTEKAGRVLGRIMRVISIIAFPALIGLFVIADDFILVLYGEQWREAILPLRILIIFALRYAVSPPIAAFFQAMGRPEINFRLGLANIPFYLAAIWVGSRFGIVGVAAGVTLVRTAFGLLGFEIVARYLKVGFGDVVKPMLPALAASLLMGGIVYLAKTGIANLFSGHHVVELLLLVMVGAVTYLLLLRSLFNGLAQEITQLSAPLLGRYQMVAARVLKTVPHTAQK